MKDETEVVDEFEYKGRIIAVHKDSNEDYYFKYNDGGEVITLNFKDLSSFIKGSTSHATINGKPVDMIERSVKIDHLLYNVGDLKLRIKKYK